MSESVVPCKQFEYNETFMGMVDTVFKPQTETVPVPVPEANGIHIYLCLISSNNERDSYDGFYQPRDSVVKLLTSAKTKEKMKLKTEERTIKIGGTKKYYFLRLLEINNFIDIADFDKLSDSRSKDDGQSAYTKYGRIYDIILKLFEVNHGCIIYAADIDSADKLFKAEVMNGIITLDNIKIDDIRTKYRTSFDKVLNDQKKEKDKKDSEDKAHQIEQESIERSKNIREAIASIPKTVDLRYQVFTIHDIGDILQLKENNKFYPRFSEPVVEVGNEALLFDWHRKAKERIDEREDRQLANYKIYKVIDNQVKQIENNQRVASSTNIDQYPNHNIAQHLSIPEGFSWVKKVNESTGIHVIKLKAFLTPDDRSSISTSKHIILGQRPSRGGIFSMYYEVTIETLNLDDTELSTEIKFKKRILTPFIDNNDNLCYFVLNAKDDNEALVYFLRKYGIHCVRSPEEGRFTFEFTHFDYINARPYRNDYENLMLTFGYNPLTLFSAVSVVHVCLKNDKLLSTDPSSESTSGSTPTQEVSAPTPEVLVLSQLTKDKIERATSVHYVLEINTDHRTPPSSKQENPEKYDFGIIDGFGGKVVMHETSWSLGCVESILDQPECTNYNELNLAAKGNKDGFKSYLSTGTFPEGFVSRGSDEYCRLVALEPYGNLFSSGDIIPEPQRPSDIHPVFYVFNALNKESAVIAFNEKLAGEINKVINNDDTRIKEAKKTLQDEKTTEKHTAFYLATRTVLNENPFFKIFKTFNYSTDTGRHLLDKPSITRFVDSINGGTPDTSLLIPVNIEIVSKTPIRTTKGGKSSKKRTKKSRRNKVRSNKRATRSNKRKHNNTRKK